MMTPSTPSRRVRALGALALAGSLALTGCTAGGGTSGALDGTQLLQIPREDMATFTRNFNPFSPNAAPMTQQAIYEPMLVFNPNDGTTTPWLAKEWTAAPDGTSITFTVRDGVKWSDGEPFTAEDVRFTFGFITNIGRAHIGTFGDFENIVRGKSELYQHLLTNKGVVFINFQNSILANMARRFEHPIFYPGEGDYYPCKLLGADPFVEVQAEDGARVTTNLIGAYNFENIAAALCIGKYFKVEASAAQEAIAQYVPSNMRSQIVKKETNTVILDAYNANPSSMEAAINNLAGMKDEPKIAIVGDMFELEEESEKEHRLLGKLLGAKKFKDVYLVGKLIKSAHEEFPAAKYFSSKEELINALKNQPIKNATVLVKASRGIGLETVVDYL